MMATSFRISSGICLPPAASKRCTVSSSRLLFRNICFRPETRRQDGNLCRPGLDRGLHRRHAPQRFGTRAAGGACGGCGECPPHAGRGRWVRRLFHRFRARQPRLAGRHPGPGCRRAHREPPHPGGQRCGPRPRPRGRSALRLAGRSVRPGVRLGYLSHAQPAENLDLLRRCREALSPGSRVVIQDFILEADKTAPRFAALFALNMLVGTRGGSSYSEPEYTGMARRGWVPGDPARAPAGNHRAHDRVAAVAALGPLRHDPPDHRTTGADRGRLTHKVGRRAGAGR
ncbi:hypothetical protein SBA4_3630011 [Candidatus Sulfopaludibacter sp. SbA4]|nr:hypothetical protein SBA4_3630011 [Candidatus Sulfopaludibacter sp. SbA4]